MGVETNKGTPWQDRKLTAKQSVMLDEYFVNGFNANNAMLTAGYTEKTARQGVNVFQQPHIQHEIKKRMDARTHKSDVTVERIMQEFWDRSQAAKRLAKFKKVDTDGSLFYDFTGATEDDLKFVEGLTVTFEKMGRGPDAITVKKFTIKEPDADKALTALARHLGFFNDKLELTGSMAERIKEAKNQGFDAGCDTDGEDATVH